MDMSAEITMVDTLKSIRLVYDPEPLIPSCRRPSPLLPISSSHALAKRLTSSKSMELSGRSFSLYMPVLYYIIHVTLLGTASPTNRGEVTQHTHTHTIWILETGGTKSARNPWFHLKKSESSRTLPSPHRRWFKQVAWCTRSKRSPGKRPSCKGKRLPPATSDEALLRDRS